MTPRDWLLVVEGMNAANKGSMPDAPTWDQYQELKKRYG